MNETLPQPVYYEMPTTPAPQPMATPQPVNAPFGGAADLGNTLDIGIQDLVQMGVVYAFIIAGALSAIFIFIGGISFILSGGNEEKIKSAVNTIRYSIVGLIITILSFTFVAIVGRIFGLNLMDYLSYQKIKDSINQLVAGEQIQMPTTQQQTTPQPAETIYIPPQGGVVPPVIPPVQ
jgi:hypothetical protein